MLPYVFNSPLNEYGVLGLSMAIHSLTRSG